MYLLVGLGNPGSQYAGHRHNVGFMAVDAIHRQYGGTPYRSKFDGEVSEVTVGGEKVMLLKPSTFMNESGRSVGAAARFYKIEPEQIVIFHDELDLIAGKIRAKEGGGLAGHKGLKSIAQQIGKDFRRVRIGIGHPGEKDRVTGHVLKDFSKEDQKWVEKTIDAISSEINYILEGRDPEFMSRVALLTNPPGEKKKTKPESDSSKAEIKDDEAE